MSFRKELTELLNSHSKDTTTNTADYILAEYLERCLTAYELAIVNREYEHE